MFIKSVLSASTAASSKVAGSVMTPSDTPSAASRKQKNRSHTPWTGYRVHRASASLGLYVTTTLSDVTSSPPPASSRAASSSDMKGNISCFLACEMRRPTSLTRSAKLPSRRSSSHTGCRIGIVLAMCEMHSANRGSRAPKATCRVWSWCGVGVECPATTSPTTEVAMRNHEVP